MRVRGLRKPFLFGNRYFVRTLPLVVAVFMVLGVGASLTKIATAAKLPSFATSSLIDQDANFKPVAPPSTDGEKSETAGPAVKPSQTQPQSVNRQAVSCAHASSQNLAAPLANSTTAAAIIIDSPSYYNFNAGSNYAETLERARQCARQQPSLSGFDASTRYAMNWSYTVVSTSDKTCKLTSVKVGMRIGQILPNADTSSLRGSELATWQASLGRLIAHENQHTALDVAAANQLHAQLSGLSTDCTTIKQEAARLTAAADANLRAENNSLDAFSHHGAL